MLHQFDFRQANVDAFASQLGLSRRTLERKMQTQVGISPHTLANLMRIQYARTTLIQPRFDLADIALACGYYDQAHFSHDFLAKTFETPHQYRVRKLGEK